MKQVVINLINVYQNFFSLFLKNILGVNKFCRFTPSCSEYSKQAIINDGIIVGCRKSLIRLLRCQPFFNF